jgi:hypothetical protein
VRRGREEERERGSEEEGKGGREKEGGKGGGGERMEREWVMKMDGMGEGRGRDGNRGGLGGVRGRFGRGKAARWGGRLWCGRAGGGERERVVRSGGLAFGGVAGEIEAPERSEEENDGGRESGAVRGGERG